MGMSRCYTLMKCLLILFNIIFLCVGSAACGFAAWALWEGGALEEAAGAGGGGGGDARAGLGALGAWGLALALAALAGLGGAARRRARWLAAGGALAAGCAAAAAAAALWGRAHAPRLRDQLARRLEASVRRDYGALPSHTRLLDVIQQGLECCGANDMSDWQGSAWERAASAATASAPGAPAAAGAPAAGAPAAPGAPAALDLSLTAPPQRYWVPPSCCKVSSECAKGARVVWGSAEAEAEAEDASGAVRVWAAPCGPRVLAALERGARAPLVAGAGLLAALAAAAALALAMAALAAAHPDTKA